MLIYISTTFWFYCSFYPCVTDECQNKYGNANAWKYCCRVFDLLTVAAVSILIQKIFFKFCNVSIPHLNETFCYS